MTRGQGAPHCTVTLAHSIGSGLLDSLTQFALGAAVGYAVLGRKAGRAAILAGGACGTLPDLDVFFPYADPVTAFVEHRGITHSIPMLTLATPIVAEAFIALKRDWRDLRVRWYTMVFLAFTTHALLDAFTTYGTQILWPFPVGPVAWSTIFIIDPLFTLPILIGLVIAVSIPPGRRRPHRANAVGLAIAGAYLGWTVAAKGLVERDVAAALEARSIKAERVMSVPLPFNSLAWTAVAVEGDAYHRIFVSLLDRQDAEVEMIRHERGADLLDALGQVEAARRLAWFGRGFVKAHENDGDIVVTDLRMGIDPNHVFAFKVAERNGTDAAPTAVVPVRQTVARDWTQLNWVWRRIWGPVDR